MRFRPTILAATFILSLAAMPFVLTPVGSVAAAAEPAAIDVSGTYTWEQQAGGGGGGGGQTTTLVLKQDGTKLTGTITGRGGETPIDDGSVDGDKVKFTVTREYNGNKMVTHYTGTVADKMLKLTATTSREIEAKRS